jgi:hypothetical protein
MSLGVLTFSDPGGVLTITDAATVSRSFDLTTFGLWARVKSLSITLTGLSHTFPDDLDFLFVGPDGTNLAFWSDAGGGTAISNQNYTIRDSASLVLPDSGSIASGTYRPADYSFAEANSNWAGVSPSLVINHPATNGAATLDGSFGGKWIDNTTWTLFVRDDASPDSGTLNDFGIQATLNGICKPHDFNGTLTGSASDILWQSNDGTAGIWLMDGFTATSVGAAGPNGPWPFNPGPSWHVKGDADFDFDGRSDILWQNNDGTLAMWRMNGLAAVTLGAVGTNPGPDWHIKGTGDFNFDGPADILWQNDNGMPAIWLMNGFSVLTNGAAGAFNPGPSWQIKGTGDFNNDGRSDILWQGADGTPAIWLMNGLTVLTNGPAGPFNPGPSWQIKGTGDFNDDGRSDILWQNSDGTPAIWLMNGMNAIAVGAVGPFNPGPSWHIVGTGDYNIDQRSDILWQADDGTPAIWFMDGMSFIGGSAAGSFNPGSDWHVIA